MQVCKPNAHKHVVTGSKKVINQSRLPYRISPGGPTLSYFRMFFGFPLGTCPGYSLVVEVMELADIFLNMKS